MPNYRMKMTFEQMRLLSGVPADGTRIGNVSLRRMLHSNERDYRTVRDELVAKGVLALGRGRGGSVYRLPPWNTDEDLGRKRKVPEVQLYPDFRRSLELWAKDQGWEKHVVVQTAWAGSKRTGSWARPDFTVLACDHFKYSPGVVRDVETFEVKPWAFGIEAVFETAAHARIATKAYLAIEAPDQPDLPLMERVEAECRRLGLGLVTFEHPDNSGGSTDHWRFLVEPVRREPDPDLLETFIDEQIPEDVRNDFQAWMNRPSAAT